MASHRLRSVAAVALAGLALSVGCSDGDSSAGASDKARVVEYDEVSLPGDVARRLGDYASRQGVGTTPEDVVMVVTPPPANLATNRTLLAVRYNGCGNPTLGQIVLNDKHATVELVRNHEPSPAGCANLVGEKGLLLDVKPDDVNHATLVARSGAAP